MQEQRIKDSQTQLQLYLEHNNTRWATTPTSNSIRNSRWLYWNRERYWGLLPQEKKFKQYWMMIEKTTSLLIESDSIEKLQLILSLNLSLMIWNASSYLSRKMFKKSWDSYSKIENEDDWLPIEQTIFERSTNRNIYLNKVLQKWQILLQQHNDSKQNYSNFKSFES